MIRIIGRCFVVNFAAKFANVNEPLVTKTFVSNIFEGILCIEKLNELLLLLLLLLLRADFKTIKMAKVLCTGSAQCYKTCFAVTTMLSNKVECLPLPDAPSLAYFLRMRL